ncbi:MAG: oxygen-independent coproporphyrinogen III oxidase [Clostridiales bacterium]|nr:oxygen-independent coproporphyrinogen III oxidase [Clostridiales bacterium]
MMKKLALYIHFPFCKQKCYYCDFKSFANKETYVESYINALCKEIEMYHYLNEKYEISSIYLGGGTPSYIDSKNIIKVLSIVRENYNIAHNSEITIEINPGTLNKEKLQDYYSSGINRISFGVQSTNDEILKRIGRIHSYKEFVENYKLAREIGFNNISVDLIFGLPEQNIEIWNKTLEDIIKLNPEHISAYSLKIEEGTPFYAMQSKGSLELPSEEIEREMYYLLKERLKKNGYEQYEISNFSKSGYESKHNIAYWERQDYLGVGSNSASCIENKRFSNEENLEKYIEIINKNELPVVYEEELNEEDIFMEEIILGLRMLKGINATEILKNQPRERIENFLKNKENLLKNGLIEENRDIIKLTDRGLDLANQVFVKFME